MKICILGAGGMGSLYGGKLSAIPTNEVWLVDVYKAHVDKINQDGLCIECDGKDTYYKNVKAVEDSSVIGVCDLVVIFVKGTATRAAIESNKNLFGPNTMALTVQNGLGNADVIGEIIGYDNVACGTTEQGARMLEPGKIRDMNKGVGKTVIGDIHGGASPRIEAVGEVLREAGFETYVSGNVTSLIWDKLIVNVGINGCAAAMNLTNDELWTIPEANAIHVAAVNEAIAVAKALGVKLSYEDPLAHVKEVCSFTVGNQCSMLLDVLNKRITEIDLINGAVVREGKKVGVPTPVNETLVNIIKVKQLQYNKA